MRNIDACRVLKNVDKDPFKEDTYMSNFFFFLFVVAVVLFAIVTAVRSERKLANKVEPTLLSETEKSIPEFTESLEYYQT